MNKIYAQPLTKQDAPIGVFDSGMGGLTVLRELKRALPQESFIYLGDTARLPYGTKSRQTVVQYAKQMAQLLMKRDIKLLVVACNTATISALPTLQTLMPHLPVVGVIEPGAKAAANATRNQNVLVLATETTVRSEGYLKAIHQCNSAINVASQACGLFVALAEEGRVNDALAQLAIQTYLSQSLQPAIDCILLGCTHFPVLKQAIADYAGPQITIVDSAIETTKEVQRLLKALALQHTSVTISPQRRTTYLVTDLPERFARIGEIFLGEPISPFDVELVDSM